MNTPFILISHAGADKNTPPFRRVLRALIDARIPVGIDRPKQLTAPAIPDELVAWQLDPSGEDFGEQIKSAIARGACGMLLLASAQTPKSSYVWREFLAAEVARDLRGPDLFRLFCLDIDDQAVSVRPDDVRGRSFHRIDDELDAMVASIREHVDRVARHESALPIATRALMVAMRHLIRKNESISVFGLRAFGGGHFRLRLDQIYTALRGDVLSADEHVAAYEQHLDLEREIRGELLLGMRRFRTPAELDRQTRLEALKVESIMPGMPLGEAARENPGMRRGGRQTLAGAVSANPALVILGEPASGKTTLLRWLGLRFAEAWLNAEGGQDADVTALARHVDPEVTGDEPVTIGRVKLPVTIAMSDVAAFGARSATDVLRLIAQRFDEMWREEGLTVPGPEFALELAHQLAREGRMIVLLDGLDEINDLIERRHAIEAVVDFAERWTRPVPRGSNEPSTENRLVITSRIVGYQELRLPENWPHAVVDRMTPDAVRSFWTRLFREFDSSEQGRAEAAADELYANVFGGTQSGLGDLAGIPLIATLLAVVFQRRASHFPRHRIEIYDSAIQYLVLEWREEANANITLARWKRWLCPIAKSMHESGGQALISEFDLEEQLIARLGELEPAMTSYLERERLTREFRHANDRYIGLLVERADGLYAFVHRTFQEYLAAQWLMDEPDAAVDRLLERWDDPRWREAVLLAFGNERLRGELRRSARDAFFHALLDRTEAGVRARLARLLAAAVVEMPSIPSEAVIARLITEILSDLAGGDLASAPEVERGRLIDAIYALADQAPDAFETAFASVILDAPPDVACAAAELMSLERWRVPVMVDALRSALPRDDARRGFPIETALRQALTEIAQRAEHPSPEEPQPRPPGAMDEDAGDADPAERRRKRLHWDIHRNSYVSRLRKWRVDGRLRTSRPFRPNAEASSFADAADADLRWRAIAAALFGAFGDRDAARGIDQYNRLSAFLQEEDAARERILDDRLDLIEQHGFEDPIYNVAVYLDTHGRDLRRDARIAPRVDLRLALPFAEIPDALSNAAANRLDSRPAAILELIGSAETLEQRMTVFFMACIANIDGTFPVYDAIRHLTHAERAALSLLTDRALNAVADAAYRSCFVLNDMKALGAATPPLCAALALALDAVAHVKPESPVTVCDAAGAMSDRMLAEWAVQRLSVLPSDDLIYTFAVALDRLQALSLERLATVIQYLPETASAAWAQALTNTSWGDVWPSSDQPGDIAPVAFDVAAIADRSGDLAPSLRAGLALVMARSIQRKADGERLTAMTPYCLLAAADSESLSAFSSRAQQQLLEAVRRLENPYWKARGLLALAECGTLDSASLVDVASEIADDIDSSVEQFIVFERLATFRAGDAWERALGAARTAAASITEPAQQWRACVRLARTDHEHRSSLLAAAVRALDAITDRFQRVEEWTAARHFVDAEARAVAEWQPSADAFRAPFLLALAEIGGLEADCALALYVTQACVDVADAIAYADHHADRLTRPRETVQAIRTLLAAAAAGYTAAIEDLERAFRASPPELTTEIARAITAIARHDPGAGERLAKSTRIITGASVRAAEAWLDDPGSALASEAAIMMVRRLRRRDASVVRPLLISALSADDERAARACQALTRGSLSWKRPPRIIRSEDVGFDGLLEVGRFMCRPENKAIKVLGAAFVLDIEFRETSIAEQLCRLGDATGSDAEAARHVLAKFGSATDEVIAALCAAIRGGSAELQAAIVEGLASIALEESSAELSLSVHVPTIVSALTQPILMLPNGGEDVVAAVDAALARGAESEWLAQAKAELAARRIDLRDRLADPAGVVAALRLRVDAVATTLGDVSPFKHGRKDLHALKIGRGRAAVTLFAAWLGELLSDDEPDQEILKYVAFAAAELGQDNPTLLSRALVHAVGGEETLHRHLAVLGENPNATCAAAALTLGCITGPLDARIVETVLRVARWPTPTTFRRLEKNLDSVVAVTDDALPFLEAALDGESVRVAAIAIRMLGVLVRNPLVSPAIRRRGRIALDGIVSSTAGRRELIMFVTTPESGEGRSLQNRGTLRDAALRELARIE